MATVHAQGLSAMASGFWGGTLKVALMNAAFVPNAESQSFIGDLTGNEVSGTGYAAASRPALTTPSVSIDAANNRVVLDAADLTIATLDVGDVGGIVVYKEMTNDSDSPIVSAFDIPTLSTIGTNVTISWPATGIANIAYS